MSAIRIRFGLISAILSLFFTAQILLGSQAMAAPTGGVVVGGRAEIEQHRNTTTIEQQSHQAIINWQGFSTAPNELVRFEQPSSSAVALNRVVGVDPSILLGRLQANGNVFLTNPNGVVFGQGSQVNVGGVFTATTLGISNSDFMAKNYHFLQDPSKQLSGVVNIGDIKAGDVLLAAPFVDNEGKIVATKGRIALGANIEMVVNLKDLKHSDLATFPDNPNFPGFTVTVPKEGVTPLILALDSTGGATGVTNPDGSFTFNAAGDLLVAGPLLVNQNGPHTPSVLMSTPVGGSIISADFALAAYKTSHEDKKGDHHGKHEHKDKNKITLTALVPDSTPVETHQLQVGNKLLTFNIFVGTTRWSLPKP